MKKLLCKNSSTSAFENFVKESAGTTKSRLKTYGHKNKI